MYFRTGTVILPKPGPTSFAPVHPFGLAPVFLFASTADTRAVCTGPEGLLLTGVGLYDDPNLGNFNAPLDRNTRWSDAGYQNSRANVFDVIHRLFGVRYGIIFHDVCWSLLEEASLWHSSPVSLQRLLDVCNSLPIPPECLSLSWGHDSGGVAIADHINYFPWEDRYGIRELGREQHPVFSKNPYHTPGVDRILAEDPEQPPAFEQAAPSVSSQALTTTDCLASLPEQLCTAIAIYLPTADVFRARLASRAFWPVFYSQQFWASRFKSSTDRSWLVEARNSSSRDWRWLYRRTNDAHISPGLCNRRRIWGLLQQVLDSQALVWRELPPTLPPRWLPDPVLRGADYRTEATGLLWRDGQKAGSKFHNGCQVFRTQSIAVPDTLGRLSVFTIAFGDGQYIVGMSLSSTAGDSVHLGYRFPSQHSVELTQLRGLRLAMGSRGLRALQCITGPEDSEHPWLGSPDDAPQSERLAVNDHIVGLDVGFDVSASHI